MNTAETQQTESNSNGNRSSCNLEEIEHLTCNAKRFGQQAKVMDEVAADLEKYAEQYGDARKKYSEARAAVVLDLEDIRTTLGRIYEVLRCRLKDDEKDCLKEQAKKVFDDIEACSDAPGCQSPCETNAGPDPETQTDIAAIAAEIARRRNNLTESAAYFVALIGKPDAVPPQIGEPDAVTQQTAKLKADTSLLEKDVTAGSDSNKVPELYARMVILAYWAGVDLDDSSGDVDLTRIGHGFKTVTEYLDCLCGVLKCLVSGWTNVAVLEGRKAQLQCYADAKHKACTEKKKDTLNAILGLYQECCEGDATTGQPGVGTASTA